MNCVIKPRYYIKSPAYGHGSRTANILYVLYDDYSDFYSINQERTYHWNINTNRNVKEAVERGWLLVDRIAAIKHLLKYL